MDPASVGLIILTSILVGERLIKLYLNRVKKSKCCGNEIEFRSTESIKKLEASSHEETTPVDLTLLKSSTV
jgi:hypothetical protein